MSEEELFTEWVGTGYDAYKINYKKEYERLNNIINKIIEFLQREQIEKVGYCDFFIEDKQIKVQDILDKLQELKGSDKE